MFIEEEPPYDPDNNNKRYKLFGMSGYKIKHVTHGSCDSEEAIIIEFSKNKSEQDKFKYKPFIGV